MVSIGTIANDAYLGIGIFMIVLTALFVIMRVAISIRQYKRMLVDDWLSFIAFAIVIAFYVFNEFQYKGFFMPPDFAYMTNAGIAIPVIAAFSLWTSKTPILVLYLRLFGVHKWMRYACYTILVASALGHIASFMPPLIQCRPFDKPYSLFKWKRCGKANIDAGVIGGAMSAAVDLCILLLPLRLIYSLNLSRRRKFGLGIVFCSGSFGVLASVLALVYKIHLFLGARGDNGSVLTTMLLQFVECAIALMVGCVPSIKAFWKCYVEPSKFYTSIGSLQTRLLSTFASRNSSHNVKPESGNHEEEHEMHKFGPMGTVNFHNTNDSYLLIESAQGSKNDINKP